MDESDVDFLGLPIVSDLLANKMGRDPVPRDQVPIGPDLANLGAAFRAHGDVCEEWAAAVEPLEREPVDLGPDALHAEARRERFEEWERTGE